MEKEPLKVYNLVMDNCGVQKNNCMVIRFFLMLCEIGIIGEVNLIFLVPGHTKKVCDKIFALLKNIIITRTFTHKVSVMALFTVTGR